MYAQGRVKKSDDPSFVSYRDNYVYFALVYWLIMFTFAVVALERRMTRMSTMFKLMLVVGSLAAVSSVCVYVVYGDDADDSNSDYEALKNEVFGVRVRVRVRVRMRMRVRVRVRVRVR